MSGGGYNIAGSSGYGAIPGLQSVTLTGTGAATMRQGSMGVVDEITHLVGRGLGIRIVPANGGIIISVRDENDPGSASDLYVISESQDIGAEIGKIITMHYLKK